MPLIMLAKALGSQPTFFSRAFTADVHQYSSDFIIRADQID